MVLLAIPSSLAHKVIARSRLGYNIIAQASQPSCAWKSLIRMRGRIDSTRKGHFEAPPSKEYWPGIQFNTDVIVTFNVGTKVVHA